LTRASGGVFTHQFEQHKTLDKIEVQQLLPVVHVQFHFKVAVDGDHGQAVIEAQ
jgi:hypothetical protein